MSAKEAVEARISELREGLAADGYQLRVEDVTDEQATMRLSLADGACSKCLIPKDLLVPMIEAQLEGLGPTRVDVHYPAELT